MLAMFLCGLSMADSAGDGVETALDGWYTRPFSKIQLTSDVGAHPSRVLHDVWQERTSEGAPAKAGQDTIFAASDTPSPRPQKVLHIWQFLLARRAEALVPRAKAGGRCRIRTCDFHRVKVALYR